MGATKVIEIPRRVLLRLKITPGADGSRIHTEEYSPLPAFRA
jgi:hypothetical protein